jgi:hypothetical protein
VKSQRIQTPAHFLHKPGNDTRLLRLTGDNRLFSRDFQDLFSTLMVSLKLETNRIRFSKFDHTFTTEEAINNLSVLKFSQTNRMPDPKDPSRILTTMTSITFSMSKDKARSVCQCFVDACFIECVRRKLTTRFPLIGDLFRLTPKGINILQRFCRQQGITVKHIMDLLDSPQNSMELVILERDFVTDQLLLDHTTIEIIFCRFAGQDGPNVKITMSNSGLDSFSGYTNSVIGVKMAKERKIGDKIIQNTFTGQAAVDWLMNCCTTIDRHEAFQIAEMFVKQELIWSIIEDKSYIQHNPEATMFQPTWQALYGITGRGQQVCGWIAQDKTPVATFGKQLSENLNHANLNKILRNPALRLLFHEFLRSLLCEKNLSFYLNVSEFMANYHQHTVQESFYNAYRKFLYLTCFLIVIFYSFICVYLYFDSCLFGSFLLPLT